MLPHQKELVQLLKDKPFALIGVNSDGEADVVRAKFAEHSINWRNAIDVEPRGPWATKWNVSGWPTIYIIDAEGKIRYRDLRGAEMDKAIHALIDEAEQG